MNDFPYNTDYTPAPAKGEPAVLSSYADYANDDPYDDGLNPARGIINAVILSGAAMLTVFMIYKFIQSLVGS